MGPKPIRRFPSGKKVPEDRLDDFAQLELGPAPAGFRAPSIVLRGLSRVLGLVAGGKAAYESLLERLRRDGTRSFTTKGTTQRLLTKPVEEPEPDASVGPMLTAPDAPRLFKFLGKTARRMHAPPPTEVRISYLPACGVMELPSNGPFPRRVLIVGFPCLQIWNQAEFAAVLGHEFAHWRHRDAKISRRLAPLLGDGRRHPRPGWPLRWLLGLLTLVFRRPALAICRKLEFRADAAAAEAFGAAALASALRKLAVAQPIFDQILIDSAARPSKCGNVYIQFRNAWQRIPQQLARRLLLRNVTLPTPSNEMHPPLADRLKRLDDTSESDLSTRPSALRLVGNRTAITAVLHNRIFADRIERVSVFHRD